MDNKYVLKMLEDGKIEELKKAVQDEISAGIKQYPRSEATLCSHEALF
jgi:hypothetical protein